jgi:pimeloyl-ACP methyl ester carboxylesterase
VAALELPVTLVFGAADRHLNPDLAGQLAGLFRHAELHLVEGASH